jgi:outer membrane protein TolC
VAARLSVRRSGASVDVERRGTLPKLDAFGSVGVATGTEATNAGLDGIPDLRTGLRFSIPLDWGPDSARLERARIEERRQRLELEDAEEGATLEVKQASIRLAARARRLELVSRVVDLSQKKLEVERDKYKSGLSTLADVVRFQRELDGALSASLRARVDVLEARTELAAARGDLHERLGIRVE